MLREKDLLTEEEYKMYRKWLYPFNLTILERALKAKLKEDPNYEVFVPMVYYRYKNFVKDGLPLNIELYNVFVSNKGSVRAFKDDHTVIPNLWVSATGYTTFNLMVGKRSLQFPLHRVLGCSFLGMPPHELGAHPKDLHVNHKDGVKTNFDIFNLEWETHAGNNAHAFKNKLRVMPGEDKHFRTKPVKGVVLGGPCKGQEFFLLGDNDKRKYGLNPSHVSLCCNGLKEEYKGCAFTFISPEESRGINRGITEEIATWIKSLPRRKPK